MDDYMEVELLEDFEEMLLGCVYDSEGNPVPAYDSGKVMDMLMAQGMTEDQAVDYVEVETEGMRLIWIHPLDIRPETGWTPKVVAPDGTLH